MKNYWPRGDNDSGVISVVEGAAGPPWELQFHTAASTQVNATQRGLREELRKTTMPLVRKRALFDLLARAWDGVPAPQAIGTPMALHPRERIVRLPRP